MTAKIILALFISALLVGPAYAQGQSGGNRPDTPASQGAGPGNSAGGGAGPSPSSPSQNANPGHGGGTPPGLQGKPPRNHDQAMEAVQSGRAVHLDEVLSQARREAGGDLIDTRLLTVDGFLLYELRMLLPDGTVTDLYYYAATGNRVTTR